MSRKGAARHPRDFVPESPQEAFREVVTAFGVPDMAAALLMVPGTLWNKCDADQDSHHKPTLADVVAVTRVTGDHRILESLDRMFNRAGYDLHRGPVNDVALLELLCKVGSDQGAMHQALQHALSDNKVSQADVAAVRGEAYDLISSVLAFVQRFDGLADD